MEHGDIEHLQKKVVKLRLELTQCQRQHNVLADALRIIANGICVYGIGNSTCLANEDEGEYCYPHLAQAALAMLDDEE